MMTSSLAPELATECPFRRGPCGPSPSGRLETARCGTDDHDGCPRYLVRLLANSRPGGRLDPWPGLR